MIRNIQQYVDKIKEYYAASKYVHSIYLAGSHSNGSQNLGSDIDLWIVCYEESHLKVFVEMIVNDMKSIYDVVGRYRPIYYHYFFMLSDNQQLDINIVSHAQFCSMQTSLELVSKNHLESNDIIGDNKVVLHQLIQMVYAELERTIPKMVKGEYIVAVRFINSIRENLLMQLLAITGNIKYYNKANIDEKQTPDDILKMFYNTFCRPEHQSISNGLKAILALVDGICKENNFDEFLQKKEQIENLLHL